MNISESLKNVLTECENLACEFNKDYINSPIILYYYFKQKNMIYEYLTFNSDLDEEVITQVLEEEIYNYNEKESSKAAREYLKSQKFFNEDDMDKFNNILKSRGVLFPEKDAKPCFIVSPEIWSFLTVEYYLYEVEKIELCDLILEEDILRTNSLYCLDNIAEKLHIDFNEENVMEYFNGLDSNTTEESNRGTNLPGVIDITDLLKGKSIKPEDVISIIQTDNESNEYRKTEVSQIFTIMQKEEANNVYLVGPEKMGKTTVITNLVAKIQEKNCPEQFYDYKIYRLDLEQMISKVSLGYHLGEEFTKFLEKLPEKSIYLIDELPAITELKTLDIVKSILNFINSNLKDKTRMIITGNIDDYEIYEWFLQHLLKRVKTVYMREIKLIEIKECIMPEINQLSEKLGVKISDKMVNKAIAFSICCHDDSLGGILDRIETAMIAAKSEKREVDLKDFKEFEIYIDLNLKESTLKSTAYHEAGHYLIESVSPLLSKKVQAISIIPMNYWLGVTFFGYDYNSDRDINYYIDRIAMDIAGRVGEELFTEKYSAGASGDLRDIKKTIDYVITQLGLVKETSYGTEFRRNWVQDMKYNRVYKKLLRKGYKRAKKLIKDNEQLYLKVVNELIKEQILFYDDLKEIEHSLGYNLDIK